MGQRRSYSERYGKSDTTIAMIAALIYQNALLVTFTIWNQKEWMRNEGTIDRILLLFVKVVIIDDMDTNLLILWNTKYIAPENSPILKKMWMMIFLNDGSLYDELQLTIYVDDQYFFIKLWFITNLLILWNIKLE